MADTFTVEAKLVGRERPVFDDWSVTIPPEWRAPGGRITLRQLITRIVGEEVAAYEARQRERELVRFLTPAEIAAGASRGKIEMGGRERAAPADLESAVATALTAFVDGFYFVFVEAEQQLSLDSTVYVNPSTRITFLRLTALVGG